MEAISQLERSYFLAKAGAGSFAECADWAMDRLRRNEEGDDANVILLAVSEEPEEVRTFTELVLERHCGRHALDEQFAGGRYLISLRHDYLRRVENVHTLDSKLQRLYERLGHPGWMSVLCRNCRHARRAAPFRMLFEKEFAYLARLWATAGSRADFESRYSSRISQFNEFA